nr:ribosomal protein L33 [Isoetes longifolia]
MAENKNVRVTITSECTSCVRNGNEKHSGVSRYTTRKNRRNTPTRMEFKKFCPYCYQHTIHKEIGK